MATEEYSRADLNLDFIRNGISSMPGGFFVYRADYDKEEILYANRALLQIFECNTAEEFFELTGGSFKGIVYEEDYYIIEQSIMNQIDTMGWNTFIRMMHSVMAAAPLEITLR